MERWVNVVLLFEVDFGFVTFAVSFTNCFGCAFRLGGILILYILSNLALLIVYISRSIELCFSEIELIEVLWMLIYVSVKNFGRAKKCPTLCIR
jgi:hypothetical protein